ncbi:MAG: phosphohydrolase [Nitrososphaerota archaeon]|nr:hypothetical protein [Nitrososphaerales archaeon]MDW8045109.1 phosphohydrolase [Nitrososphaerota archaeon]
MVLVSPNLIYSHLKEPNIEKVFNLLESDVEVQTYLRMSNCMAVDRLGYNDHGPVHSRIASGSALEIFRILSRRFVPTTVKDGICDMEGAAIIVLCGTYLHDIGNAIHRVAHHIHGCNITNPILDRILSKVYPNDRVLITRMKSEILHCIFSHDERVKCLSMEAGISKVADGTDMAEGRARIPYRSGKVDIHSLSALSIKSVEIQEGSNIPVKILVNMDNPAGVFQIEEVLQKKVATSGIDRWIEIIALKNGEEIKTISAKR